MMKRWKAYYTPSTVAEALTLLDQHNGGARLIAGGTDLILDMESGHVETPEVLVDVTRIVGIDQIGQERDQTGDWIVIGAGVTHYQIERHPLLRRVATCLTESCGVVGGPQVRNVATLGGNVAHALPAADGTIGLLALDAQVQICSLRSGSVLREWRPLLSLFNGPGRNTLERNQMIAAFRFRRGGEREGSAFDRIMRPQGVALPILGIAVRLRLDDSDDRVTAATIAIGPAGPIPFRASEAESLLVAAKRVDAAAVEAAVAAAQQQVHLRTSQHRATKEYRHEMVAVLLRRVLPKAVKRAQGDDLHHLMDL